MCLGYRKVPLFFKSNSLKFKGVDQEETVGINQLNNLPQPKKAMYMQYRGPIEDMQEFTT